MRFLLGSLRIPTLRAWRPAAILKARAEDELANDEAFYKLPTGDAKALEKFIIKQLNFTPNNQREADQLRGGARTIGALDHLHRPTGGQVFGHAGHPVRREADREPAPAECGEDVRDEGSDGAGCDLFD